MSNQIYITNILELKDNNIKLFNNCYYKEKIKEFNHKIFEGYLSYQPTRCYHCRCVFDNLFEKHGFIEDNNNFIKVINKISDYK